MWIKYVCQGRCELFLRWTNFYLPQMGYQQLTQHAVPPKSSLVNWWFYLGLQKHGQFTSSCTAEENVFLLSTSNSPYILGDGWVLVSHSLPLQCNLNRSNLVQVSDRETKREPLLKSQENIYLVIPRWQCPTTARQGQKEKEYRK